MDELGIALGHCPEDASGGDDLGDEDIDMEFPTKKPLNSPDEVLQYWNTSLEKGTLSCLHFREWWRQKVPKIFSPVPSMNYQKPTEHIEEDDVQRMFFDPLERFLCNGDPTEILKQLSSLNDPPAQCGKVFKMGEPTYSCRDCGLDPTCVLCVDCFKSSEHGTHRYKMSTSNGGGYCDCGDVEAWKKHAYCATHILGTQSEGCDPLSKVPADIQERARHVFSNVLKFAYELLTLDTFMKLPGDLQYKERDRDIDPLLDDLLEVDDLYATVLYNDEVHTFEEVITTLQRAVECDRNAAINFVSLIDREGRSLVKCAPFQQCSEVKRIVERITGRRGIKPLKVMVIHSHVVAHQVFAMRMISWLDGILAYSEGFRALFSLILVEQEQGVNSRKQPSILEGILRHDTVLWKAARSSVHHMLISGILLEMASKKEFATVFTNNYGAIIKDFIQDDHEQSYSVTSLSVQLFTVPTLAHYLIANQDVLSIILRTFMSECERKRNAKGKLEFERNLGLPAFRRATYVLNDLKYLLSVPPVEFDDKLRKGFLHGYSMLLDVLGWIQCMDNHIRQVNQHVEFEADWENGFNLHIKLAPVIALVLNWCSSDYVLFVKAYRMLLKKLHLEVESEEMAYVSQSVNQTTVDCVEYNVSVQTVSMHLPLTRLLAGLNLHLEKFGFTYDCRDFEHGPKPSLVQLLEHPLRTAVMVAQVYAGMWRRNGYSLQHQIFFYHNVRCRGEMYDRDVHILQFCASNIPPDQFLVHLLYKFGLANWARRDFEIAEDDSVRHLTMLIEEMLGLLITLIGERHSPGVGDITAEDAVRKEVIQLLCIEPLSHSALNKALQTHEAHETGMEKVIDEVANFKKPTGASGKGVYELKEEFFSQYDAFYYHFTREDQSKAEEAQRLRQKTSNNPQVAPPPALPGLTPIFSQLTHLLQSDLMLFILELVLERADNLKSRCFSETQVQKALHLIAMALQEEERLNMLNPQSDFKFTQKAEDPAILKRLEALTGSQRIESHKEMLAWTIRKFRKVAGKEENKMDECGTSEVEEPKAAADKMKKAKASAAARRAKIMAQMASQQKTFMKENSKLFDETATGKDQNTNWDSEMEEVSGFPVCLGLKRNLPTSGDARYTCILCQEEEDLGTEARTLVMAAFVQKSTVLSRRRSDPLVLPDKSSFPFLPADLSSAPHTSSCGHVMHAACWQKYYDDIAETERRRYRTRHPASFDIDKEEWLCPLCRCLSNTVMPLIPQYFLLQQPQSGGPLQSTEQTNSDAMESTEESSASTESIEFSDGSSSQVPVPPRVYGFNNQPTSVVESTPVFETIASASRSSPAVVEVPPSVLSADNVLSIDPPLVFTTTNSTAIAEQTVESSLEANSVVESTVTSVQTASGGSRMSTDPVSFELHSPPSISSSSTESFSSESTFISATSTTESSSESSKDAIDTEKDGAKLCDPETKKASDDQDEKSIPRSDILIDYSQWLEALFIALKYKKGLSPDLVKTDKNGGEGEPQTEEETEESPVMTSLTRYYTCPLDQVVSELDQLHHDGHSFSRLFTVAEGGELAFHSTVYEFMNVFSQATYRIGLEVSPHLQDERIPLLVWQSCAMTVHSIVVSAMDAGKPIFGSLSSRQNDCLSCLIRFCGVVGSNFGEPKVIRSHSLKLLSTVLEVDTGNPSILEVDMFGILVALTFSLPSLFNGEAAAPLPSANIQDQHILWLTFQAHLTQILLSTDEFSSTPRDTWRPVPPPTDCRAVLDLLQVVREGNDDDTIQSLNPLAVWQDLMSSSLGFLRCAALFYHYLSGVAAPTELTQLNTPDVEFCLLARFLSLPSSPSALLDSPFLLGLAKKWSNHPNVHIAMSTPSLSPLIPFQGTVPQLIDLPRDYSELINSVSSFTCPRSLGDDSRAPSMCLVCGTVVCSQSYCCQAELDGLSVGACTAHSHSCGAGTGLFLRVRECKVVLFSGRTKGCFVSPPYLDQYGETDQGLRRGNPLTLCQERYKRLHKLWLNHGIAEEITHNLESSPGFVATEWIHL